MNIYVGNLSYETNKEDLKKAFDPFGEVSNVNVIKDKFTDRSKGFGFVEMPDKAQAQSAIEGLNGKDLKGRSLNVNEARPRSEGSRGGSKFGGLRHSRGGSDGGGRRRF